MTAVHFALFTACEAVLAERQGAKRTAHVTKSTSSNAPALDRAFAGLRALAKR